ncbi:MAG TPA: DUF4198 domain-containing protein [Thermoanaerobaculia bacterium]|nr:DUF4198 domain-containing protein [Thermoanaerobaculia bacterium]
MNPSPLSLPAALAGAAIAVAALALPRPALAHDFWIEPSDFHPARGARVQVNLLVGENWKGQPVPRNPKRLVSLDAVSEAGREPIPGVDGGNPAGAFVTRAPGLVVVAYRGSPALIELGAVKFEAYLREEGLERVALERARRGESDSPGRESYARCAKALLDVGGAGSAGRDRATGLPLELVADASTFALAPGAPLGVTVLLDGAPLSGTLVVATKKGSAGPAIRARSDAAGRVLLPIDAPGTWLVKTVHMVRARAGSPSDWESLWASLTFDLPSVPSSSRIAHDP